QPGKKATAFTVKRTITTVRFVAHEVIVWASPA
ncbi:MAG: hypothetical protein ACI8PT_001043, partial [Gammaproteobacteria bacterium]